MLSSKDKPLKIYGILYVKIIPYRAESTRNQETNCERTCGNLVGFLWWIKLGTKFNNSRLQQTSINQNIEMLGVEWIKDWSEQGTAIIFKIGLDRGTLTIFEIH